MSEYCPDKWCIIKINGEDPHYRVFGTWSGGYLDSDKWRMNSGIVEVIDDGDFLNFIGSSGSVYKCHKEMYGTTMYGLSVISTYRDYHKDKFEPLLEEENWLEKDWIING